ncbi:MAG: RNA polymerase sigma factor [Nodosilinea sp.]
MSKTDDASGNQVCRSLSEASVPDVFDQALSEILGLDNPRAYSILSAIQRTLNQYRLASHVESHEILHEAYLRGKKKLQSGETIHNVYAWLKATAIHVIYERKRKARDGATEPHILEAVLPDNRVNLMQQQILSEELDLLYQCLGILHQEDPETTRLLYLRTVKGLTWNQIREVLIAQGEPSANEATLRQRASRGKRRLRDIYLQQSQPAPSQVC